MTCRAPTNTVTCAGTPTGSVMTYDNERRLATWQNTPSNPTSTASYWYDGEGQRVAQTLNGVTTYYVGSDEEITGSTLLKYYHIPGLPVLGTITGVTRTYLASDGLGSETVNLSYNGTVLATALYGPYGVGRYATGTLPTSRGYTGQRQDSGSGLDYYVARYYDPLLAQFTSGDALRGPNRFAYVSGNPSSRTDPSGFEEEGDRQEGGGFGSDGQNGDGNESSGAGGGGGGSGGSFAVGPSADANTSSITLGNGDVLDVNGDGSQYTLENAQGEVIQEGQTEGTQFELQADMVQNGEVQNEGSEIRATQAKQQNNTNQPTNQPTNRPANQPPKTITLSNTVQTVAENNATAQVGQPYTAGSVVNEGVINGEPYEYVKTDLKGSNDALGHAEAQGTGWGVNDLSGLAGDGASGSITTTVITANFPCLECQESFGEWANSLSEAAGPNITVTVQFVYYPPSGTSFYWQP